MHVHARTPLVLSSLLCWCVWNQGDTFARVQWGFIGESPGNSLQFMINSNGTASTDATQHASVTINHLKSYENMGNAGLPSCPTRRH